MEHRVFAAAWVSDHVGATLSCDGEQVIPTSVAIFGHMQQCAAIAEIESGEDVENSLLAAPDGQSYVRSTVELFETDPWGEIGMEYGAGEGDKGTKDAGEGGKGEGRGKNEGDGGMQRTLEERGTKDDRAASAALLALHASRCS
jgi:hypothetical protein